ncbi:MAG TPA: hypothetical protein DHW34_03440 [Actinobacteria bacterium]|nr:hypothetical protein [Actinomycetota bacterium]HCK79054.1 hypothetical protein [Actinomycetota bacterium]
MSLPKDLADRTLATMVDRLGATEVTGDDGGPYLTLTNVFDGSEVGMMRVFKAPAVPKIVYCGLTVEKFKMDTHMIFGFTPSESPLPHFTLDSVNANGSLAFHLDLITKAELSVHVPYMDYVYGGLTDTFKDTISWEGLSRAQVGPRQYAMMSPWMLVSRATEPTFRRFSGADEDKPSGPVNTYVNYWIDLVEKGVPEEIAAGVPAAEAEAHDRQLRYNLFSPEVDPVWGDVGKIVGEEPAEKMRAMLLSNAY